MRTELQARALIRASCVRGNAALVDLKLGSSVLKKRPKRNPLWKDFLSAEQRRLNEFPFGSSFVKTRQFSKLGPNGPARKFAEAQILMLGDVVKPSEHPGRHLEAKLFVIDGHSFFPLERRQKVYFVEYAESEESY